MRYKDLPDFEEVQKLHDSLYTEDVRESWISCLSLEHDDGYVCHSSLLEAYTYLRNNPELEVSDEFFGNSFPFLHGVKLKPHKHSIESFVICGLTAFDSINVEYIAKDCDFLRNSYIPYSQQDIEGSQYHNFISDSTSKKLHVSCYGPNGLYYFATKTHSELLKRIEVLKIMHI